MKKILKTLSAYVILSLSYLPTLTASKLFPEFSKIDLLITNGQVLDGLGNKVVLSDVVIVGDEIVFVGQTNFSTEELRLRVKKSINAKQRILAPGFIDLHSHGDPLAKIVGKNDRLIMSHMRNEDSDQLSASIAELVRQGQFAKVHISHIKSVYGAGDSEAEDIIKIFRYAKKSGIQLSADIYPYNASYAGISLLFPVWAKTTEQFVVVLKERREELEQFLRDKIIKRNGPEATLLGTSPYTGKTLADLAKEFDMAYEQVLIKLGPKGASAAYFIMDDELQSRLLVEPQISISSDGSPIGFHPRRHGTFAKIIEQYVNQRNSLSLTEAVRKMTSEAAKILGITDRGIIRAGMKADIIIFDPSQIKANASYSKPHLLAQGFDTVIINGNIARQSEKMNTALFGKVLKP